MKEHEHELLVLGQLPMAVPKPGPLANVAAVVTRLVRRKEAQVGDDGIVSRTPKGDARLKGPRTPCCGVLMVWPEPEDPRDGQACVEWNPYNGVVQCHSCGHIYIPADAAMTLLSDDEAPYRLWKEAGGGLKE